MEMTRELLIKDVPANSLAILPTGEIVEVVLHGSALTWVNIEQGAADGAPLRRGVPRSTPVILDPAVKRYFKLIEE